MVVGGEGSGGSGLVGGFVVPDGPYVTEIDAEALKRADRLGFPILALPPAVSFDDLIADIYATRDSMLLGGLHRKSDREQELMTVALGGGGPAEVAERLAELVQCEVLVLGPGRDVIAHLSGVEGTAPSRDPHEGSEFDEAIGAPIVFGSTYVGQLHVFPNPGTVADFFPGLVPTCARIMALAASRETAVASVDRQFRTEFLELVLRNRLDRTEVDRRCQALEWSLHFPAVVVSLVPVDLGATTHLERVRDMLGWSLRPRGLRAPHAIVGSEIVAIVGSDDAVESAPEAVAAEAAAEVISRSIPGLWSAGVSDRIETPEGLERGWDQARMAAKVTRALKGVGAIGRFRELGVYRLLIEVDPSLLKDFAREVLGELFDPVAERTDLKRTLSVLLDTNLNVAQTARELHYHYNSIRYRTVQLEKMLGPFLTDPTRRLELQIALLIGDMVTDGSGNALVGA